MDKRRVNVRAIIWHEGKLFAVKHKQQDGSESEYWCLPGGGLDPFESLEDGVRRELLEETGITAKVGRMLFGQQLRSTRPGRDEELEFFYHITNPEDFINIDLANTSHGAEELARYEFIDPEKEYLLPGFLQTIGVGEYVDNVLPVRIVDNLNEGVV